MAWQVDTAHTQISFGIQHLGISFIRGSFRVADAQLKLDEAQPENSKLTARIDVASLDTRDATRDGHLKTADFFDAEKFPYMVFQTKRIIDKGNGKFEVTGDLTIKDVTREIALQGEYRGPAHDPISGKRKVGFLLTGEIYREQFGMDWNVPMQPVGMMLANSVSVQIDAQAIEA